MSLLTQTRICADCGEFFPAERGETVCRLCCFGPLAAIVAGMRDALRDAARAVDACMECQEQGFPICAVCTVWAAEQEAFEKAADLKVIG